MIWICSVGSGTSIVRVIGSLRYLKFCSDIIHISEKLMSYPPVIILTIEGLEGEGGEGGGGGGWVSVGLFCPVVRLSHEEFNLVPERTFR